MVRSAVGYHPDLEVSQDREDRSKFRGLHAEGVGILCRHKAAQRASRFAKPSSPADPAAVEMNSILVANEKGRACSPVVLEAIRDHRT